MQLIKYKKFLESHVSISSIEWNYFKSLIKIDHHHKGEIIHHAGSICTRFSFINYGIVRSYVVDIQGKDYTWDIHFNDDNSKINNVFIVDCDSFTNSKTSRLSFEVLEDCQLIAITNDAVQSLYTASKNGERLGRLLVEMAYSHSQNIILDRLTKTAEQRYQDFINKTPYLLDKVPQYHIATLLGIAPQSLSRIKNAHKNNNTILNQESPTDLILK
jgi:CRP-like cAMP-binding protein